MLALVRRDLCRSLFRANEACFWHGAWRHQHSPGGKWFGWRADAKLAREAAAELGDVHAGMRLQMFT
jgi:hypothetical protein